MTPLAAPLAQLFLSLAAVAGLALLYRALTAQSPDDPITRRFLFGVRVTLLLFAGRALVVATGADWFLAFVLLAGALVPLAVLLLTEGLLRRHAPLWAKAFAAGGAVIFSVVAFLPAAWVADLRVWGLLAYQIGTLTICGWMVVTRDRASLNAAENETVGLLALSLVLLVPLIGVDFMTDLVGLPVQLSALGVLVLCWLAIGLGRPGKGYRATLLGLAGIAAISIFAGLVIGAMVGDGWTGGVIGGAVVAAAVLVVAILGDAQAARQEAQSLTLLSHLAAAPTEDPLTFLRGLQTHPAVEGAAVIEGEALGELDGAVLDRLFAARPVLRRADPAPVNAVEADHASHLFARFAASHIITVKSEPRLLVALNMPSLATSPRLDLELQAVQRMASLMGARDEA